jgi:hypothetical protein
MPLRLARYGVPLAETAPAGLAAAGIEPALLPPAPQQALHAASAADAAAASDVAAGSRAAGAAPVPQRAAPPSERRLELDSTLNVEQLPNAPEPDHSPWFEAPRQVAYQGGYDPTYDPQEQYEQWYAEQLQAEQYQEQYQQEPPSPEISPDPSPEETGSFPIPAGPGRTRNLGEGGGTPEPPEPDEEAYYQVFKQSIDGSGYPTPREFSNNVEATYGIPVLDADAKRMVMRFTNRFNAELEEDHIA